MRKKMFNSRELSIDIAKAVQDYPIKSVDNYSNKDDIIKRDVQSLISTSQNKFTRKAFFNSLYHIFKSNQLIRNNSLINEFNNIREFRIRSQFNRCIIPAVKCNKNNKVVSRHSVDQFNNEEKDEPRLGPWKTNITWESDTMRLFQLPRSVIPGTLNHAFQPSRLVKRK